MSLQPHPPVSNGSVSVDVSWVARVQASQISVAIQLEGESVPSVVDVFPACDAETLHAYPLGVGCWEVAIDVFLGDRLVFTSSSRRVVECPDSEHEAA